jgi:hypothetical protein
MSVSNKPHQKKTTVVELLTFTFDESSSTSLSIGSNAYSGNLIFKLSDKDNKNVGYIMWSEFWRINNSENCTYYSSNVALYLNNNKDIIAFNCAFVSGLNAPEISTNTEISTKATYTSGKYQGKDVNVNIKFLKDNKRKVTLTYKA